MAHSAEHLTCSLSPGSVWGQPSVLRCGAGRPGCLGKGAAAGSCCLCGQPPDGAPWTAESQTSHPWGHQVRLRVASPPARGLVWFLHSLHHHLGWWELLSPLRRGTEAPTGATAQDGTSGGRRGVKPGSNFPLSTLRAPHHHSYFLELF